MATVIVGVLGVAIGWNGRAHRLFEPTRLPVSTYTTTNGQRANITLLDGTTVALNVASRLDVPADFAAGNHTVYLTGEGLFTVSHHEGKPFTVISGPTRTRVLGTSFVVRHYPTDATTTVTVKEGKVAVDSTVVLAQHLVEIGRNGVVHSQRADMSAFSFATGILTVNDTPLPDGIAELDRWYDADIRLGDSVLARQQIKERCSWRIAGRSSRSTP